MSSKGIEPIHCLANRDESLRHYLHEYPTEGTFEFEVEYHDDESNYRGSVLIRSLKDLKEMANILQDAIDLARKYGG